MKALCGVFWMACYAKGERYHWRKVLGKKEREERVKGKSPRHSFGSRGEGGEDGHGPLRNGKNQSLTSPSSFSMFFLLPRPLLFVSREN